MRDFGLLALTQRFRLQASAHRVRENTPEATQCFSSVLGHEQIIPPGSLDFRRVPRGIWVALWDKTRRQVLEVERVHFEFDNCNVVIQG